MSKKISENTSRFQMKEKILVRERLINAFSEALLCPLIEVVAEAGYGKTYFIKSCLQYVDSNSCWLQITNLDNIPDKFMKSFLKALTVEFKELSSRLERLSFPDSLDKVNTFIRILSEEAYMKERMILVFDDFHRIKNNDIRNLIQEIIFSNIENLNIVLISRKEIPIEISSMLNNQLVYRITVNELHFLIEETNTFFELQGIELTKEQIMNIQQTTEGWPLAISITALQLKNNYRAYENSIKYTNYMIYTMIEAEIFSQYPQNIQEFFIKLSLLDMNDYPWEMIRQLADDNVPDIYECLNSNMFILYGEEQEQYHFHQMFLSFLKAKRYLITKETEYNFFRKAGKWFEEHMLKLDALTCYKMISDDEGVYRIISGYGTQHRSKAVAELFLSYLNELSEAYVTEHQLALVTKSNLLMHEAKFEESMKLLEGVIERAEKKSLAQKDSELLGEAYLSLGLVHSLVGLNDTAFYYKKSYEYLPGGSRYYDNTVLLVDSNSVITFKNYQADNLGQTVKDYFEGFEYAIKVMNGSGKGIEYLGLAEANYYTGNLNKALESAHIAIAEAKTEQQFDIVCGAYYVLNTIAMATGKYLEIQKYLEEMDEYMSNMDVRSFFGMPDIIKGWVYCHINQPENVARWILDEGQFIKNQPTTNIGREQIIKAEYYLQTGDYYRLLTQAEMMEERYMQRNLWILTMKAKIYKAIVYYQIKDTQKAIIIIQEAYDISKANKIIMPFIEFGNAMRNIINIAKKNKNHTIPKEWLNNIYSKATTYAKRQIFITAQMSNYNCTKTKIILSDREKDILSDLCQGLTREEIAHNGNISINTVKTFLKNIYSKLGAVNGMDAIRIATANHLLR